MSKRARVGTTELVRNQRNLLRSLQLADTALSTECPMKRRELVAKARLAFLTCGVAPAESMAMLLGAIGGSCEPEASASGPAPEPQMLTRAVDALGDGLSAERLNAEALEALRQLSEKSRSPVPSHPEAPLAAARLRSSGNPCERLRSLAVGAAKRIRSALGWAPR